MNNPKCILRINIFAIIHHVCYDIGKYRCNKRHAFPSWCWRQFTFKEPKPWNNLTCSSCLNSNDFHFDTFSGYLKKLVIVVNFDHFKIRVTSPCSGLNTVAPFGIIYSLSFFRFSRSSWPTKRTPCFSSSLRRLARRKPRIAVTSIPWAASFAGTPAKQHFVATGQW